MNTYSVAVGLKDGNGVPTQEHISADGAQVTPSGMLVFLKKTGSIIHTKDKQEGAEIVASYNAPWWLSFKCTGTTDSKLLS